jgi:hypothetical protein
MSEWKTPSRTRTTTPNAVTPETTPRHIPTENRYDANRYDALAWNFADEEIDFYTVEENNPWDNINMTDEKTTTMKSVEAYIKMDKDKNVMKPLKEPTKMEVIKFKRQLATALMKCRGAPQLVGGHAYLILTEAEFRLRINDPKATLPTAPKIPVAPATADATSASVYIFREEQKAYELHTEYEQQTKDLLEKKFTNGTIGLQDDDGEIPYGTTAKTILEHIESKLHDDNEVNRTGLKLLREILDL